MAEPDHDVTHVKFLHDAEALYLAEVVKPPAAKGVEKYPRGTAAASTNWRLT